MGLQCPAHFCVETPPLSLCFLVWGWGLSRVLIAIVRAGEEPPLLYTVMCVCGVKCANSSYIPLLTDLGTGEGVQKNQHEEGTTRYWWMPPKLREPKAWILPLNGSSLQGIILGTTEQVGRSGAGSQDYPSLLFGSQRVLPCFFLFNGNSKCQPRAEVANAQ